MNAKIHRGHKAVKHLHRISRKGAHMVKKTFKRTFVTLGDLVTAAYNVGGSTDAAARLLSPLSPLYHLLGRRIVLAHSH